MIYNLSTQIITEIQNVQSSIQKTKVEYIGILSSYSTNKFDTILKAGMAIRTLQQDYIKNYPNPIT